MLTYAGVFDMVIQDKIERWRSQLLHPFNKNKPVWIRIPVERDIAGTLCNTPVSPAESHTEPPAQSHIRWRMLTYADVCWRMLTYADVCWRMRARPAPAQSDSRDSQTTSTQCSLWGPVEDGQVFQAARGATWICRFSRIYK
jgi:hypothetical protein